MYSNLSLKLPVAGSPDCLACLGTRLFRIPTSLEAGEIDMADEGLPDGELPPSRHTRTSESYKQNV